MDERACRVRAVRIARCVCRERPACGTRAARGAVPGAGVEPAWATSKDAALPLSDPGDRDLWRSPRYLLSPARSGHRGRSCGRTSAPVARRGWTRPRGGSGGNRTLNTPLKRRELCHLSYGSLVDLEGVEPSTSRFRGERSAIELQVCCTSLSAVTLPRRTAAAPPSMPVDTPPLLSAGTLLLSHPRSAILACGGTPPLLSAGTLLLLRPRSRLRHGLWTHLTSAREHTSAGARGGCSLLRQIHFERRAAGVRCSLCAPRSRTPDVACSRRLKRRRPPGRSRGGLRKRLEKTLDQPPGSPSCCFASGHTTARCAVAREEVSSMREKNMSPLLDSASPERKSFFEVTPKRWLLASGRERASPPLLWRASVASFVRALHGRRRGHVRSRRAVVRGALLRHRKEHRSASPCVRPRGAARPEELSMKQVTIHVARTQLSRLIEEACAGEEILIARGGASVVRLVPVEAPPAARVFGSMRGRARVDDAFFEPLPAGELG